MDPITGLPRRSTISGSDAQREGINTETQDWTLIRAGGLIERNVIVIDGDTSIEEACDILIQKNISSAPVYDSTTKSFVGMFDWSDVMSYLLIVLKKKNILEQQQKSDDELKSEFKDLLRLATECQPVPVKLASDLSNKNPFHSISPETPLLKVVELFGSGIHRVIVIDTDGTLKGILTQSKVVSYLYQNVIKFPPIEQLFPKSILDLDIGKSYVISAQADSFVLDALTMMNDNKLSSIAIIDEEERLLGNLSMTDVKYILRNYNHSFMWRTCQQFVAHVRSRQGLEDGQDRYPVFDVRPTSTLGYTIAKLTATKAHRVWVVDERVHAIGVISLTDILSVVARSAGANPKPKPKRSSNAALVSTT